MKNIIPVPFLLFLIFASTSGAQNISGEESKQFDFWIGEWSLTWNDTLRGTNIITKEWEDHVIHENFRDSKNKYFGQSFSVYNAKKKIWEQTWVDSEGNYMQFTGGLVNKEMILNLIASDTGSIKRMRFTNINRNNFDWYWELSKDEGKTWSTLWLIHYKRKMEDKLKQ